MRSFGSSVFLSVLCLFLFVSHSSAGDPRGTFVGKMLSNVSTYFDKEGMGKVSDEMSKRVCQGQTIKEIIKDLINVLMPGVNKLKVGELVTIYKQAGDCFKDKNCKTKQGGPSSMDYFLDMSGGIFVNCLKNYTMILKSVAKKQGSEVCLQNRTQMYKAASTNWKPNLFCQCARSIYSSSSEPEWKCVMDHVSKLVSLKKYNVKDAKCKA